MTPTIDAAHSCTFQFIDRLVTQESRAKLLEALPALGDSPAYRSLLCHLLFSNLRDVDTNQIMLPYQILAQMEGKIADTNYSGMKLLDSFRRDVLPFSISDHIVHPNPRLAKCRSVKSFDLPPPISALVDQERLSKESEKVWMTSGKQFGRNQRAALKKQRIEASLWFHDQMPQDAPCRCEPVQTLLAHMNNLPENRFYKCLVHLDDAKNAAQEISDKVSRERQLDILEHLRQAPQPVYRETESCTRIFAIGDSMLGLKSNLRKIMTQDWITADLRSAQLGIVAAVWQVEEISEYLRSGKNIWEDLCAHMNAPYDHDHKDAIKTALYALTYGAGKRRITEGLGNVFGPATRAHKKMMEHPIMAALRRARLVERRKVRDNGGAHDAFGNFLPLTWKITSEADYFYDNKNSILARVAQSYELKLLYPVLKAAIENSENDNKFSFCTWLHDGFAFTCKTDDQESWKQRLGRLVWKQARELGIVTALEFS